MRRQRPTPLLTVQNGDFEGFRQQLPPRDYFTDEIRRQLSDELRRRGILRRRPDRSAPRSIPTSRRGARARCAAGWRSTTAARASGAARGEAHPADVAGRRGQLARGARRSRSAARHRRLVPGGGARAGRERRPHRHRGRQPRTTTATSSQPRRDLGAHPRRRRRPAEAMASATCGDVGDVVLRQASDEDGDLHRWSLPPDPGDPGRLHGDGREDRPRPRHAGRLLLPVLASSTARRRRSASRARPSSPSSMPPRSIRASRPATIVIDAPDRGGDRRKASGSPKNASNTVLRPRRRCAPASSSRGT